MLSKLSKPPTVSALSILNFVPEVRDFGKSKKGKAFKMLTKREYLQSIRCKLAKCITELEAS
jgi:hypothetical protein